MGSKPRQGIKVKNKHSGSDSTEDPNGFET
jgi:hypothetical protein